MSWASAGRCEAAGGRRFVTRPGGMQKEVRDEAVVGTARMPWSAITMASCGCVCGEERDHHALDAGRKEIREAENARSKIKRNYVGEKMFGEIVWRKKIWRLDEGKYCAF